MTTMTNTGPHFMKLLEWIPFNKLDLNMLSVNRNAIPILEKNLDKVNWNWLSRNPNIFTYDYNEMKDRMYNVGIKEDLMKNRFHPTNLHKFKGWGFEAYDYDDE